MTTAERIVNLAQSKLDDPYVYGATGPEEFDCEGLVVWIMNELGVDFTRGTSEQWAAYPHAETLEPGQAVYFYGGEVDGPRPGHVGIFVGYESPEVARMVSALDESSGVCWSSFSPVVDQESTEPLAYWGSIDLAALVPEVQPQPQPEPKPDPPAPPPTEGDSTMGLIVQATGDTAVYLVGGVPVTRQHLSPEEESALEGFGYPAKRGCDPSWVAAIHDAPGYPAPAVAVEPQVAETSAAPLAEEKQ